MSRQTIAVFDKKYPEKSYVLDHTQTHLWPWRVLLPEHTLVLLIGKSGAAYRVNTSGNSASIKRHLEELIELDNQTG